MMIHLLLLYIALGIATGLLTGLLGIGGGLIIVPGLLFIFKLNGIPEVFWMHLAAGTSLSIIVLTACSSALAYHRNGDIAWRLLWFLLPGMVLGVIAGVIGSSLLESSLLIMIFGIFLIAVSFQIFFAISPYPVQREPHFYFFSMAGFLIGCLSGLLGVGGGSITIPFLLYCRVPLRRALGTSIACIMPVALVGAVSAMWIGKSSVPLPYTIGYVYWPAVLIISLIGMIFAQIGERIGRHVPVVYLRRTFAVFLFFGGLKMLW